MRDFAKRNYLTDPLEKIIKNEAYGSISGTTIAKLKIAELGNDAGIIGAAMLGL